MIPAPLLVYFIIKVDGSKKEQSPLNCKLVSGPEDANESQDESSKPAAEPKTEK